MGGRLNCCYLKYKLFLNILMQISQIKSRIFLRPRKIVLFLIGKKIANLSPIFYYSGKKRIYKT